MTAVFVSMLTLGLVTSLHCVSMCGPMVVSYALKGTEDHSALRRVIPNVAYQAAKISSYVVVGLVLGALGSAFNIDSVRPYVMLLAGAFMIVMGLGMTGRVKWALRLVPRPPKFLTTALVRTRRKAAADASSGENTLATPVTFGLLTGLFPCAPLIAAQLSAAATGSSLTGGFAMLAFGVGTAPLMLGFGTASSLIPKNLKERVMVVLALVVIVFGAVYVNRGLMRVGSPVTFRSVSAAFLGSGATTADGAQYTTGADGVVEVPLSIQNTRFVPSQLSIPADKPVRLVVDRQEDNACSDQIAVPQLGVLKDLAPFATTVVDLPAAKSGRYTLTCGMGMMSGLLVVGAPAAAGNGPLLWVLLVLAIGGAGLAYSLGRRRAQQAAANAAPPTGAKGSHKGTGPRTGPGKSGKGGNASHKGGNASHKGGASPRKGAVPAKRAASSSKGAAASATTVSGLFGLSPQGTIVVSALVVSAVIAGLAFGGLFAR